MVVVYNPFKKAFQEVAVADAVALENSLSEGKSKYNAIFSSGVLTNKLVLRNPFKAAFQEITLGDAQLLEQSIIKAKTQHPELFN